MSDLLVLLHGYGADERDLLPLATLVAPGAAVLAPRAPHPAGPGWSWSHPGADVLAGDGLDSNAGALLGEIDGFGADRVSLVGFSQGGAMAVELLRARPGLFARTALLSSFIREPERDDPAVAALAPLVLWGRGDLDDRFDEASLRGTARWLRRCTTPTERVYPGLGHGIAQQEVGDVAAFLAA